jgi:hypothetical protein
VKVATAGRKNPLHIHAQVDAALGQGKRQQLIAHPTFSLLQPSPRLPSERRDGEPRNRSEDVAQAGHRTIISQITRTKAASPKLPSTAPAASSAALPADPLSACVPGHVFRSSLRTSAQRVQASRGVSAQGRGPLTQ